MRQENLADRGTTANQRSYLRRTLPKGKLFYPFELIAAIAFTRCLTDNKINYLYHPHQFWVNR
jgi:hypothetical protein